LAKTPEAKVKDKIKKILKAHGVYYVMPIGSGYGNAGVPDFVCCYKGFFMAIEAKASGNMATVLQAKNLEEIINARGVALVVNENNLHAIEGWLKILEVKAQ
jgi:Holliday junction resolvase